MSLPHSVDPEEQDNGETNETRRGSTHSIWAQRRQAKPRNAVRGQRRRTTSAAKRGMHLRRNKRVNW
jgi:hypothetical protein